MSGPRVLTRRYTRLLSVGALGAGLLLAAPGLGATRQAAATPLADAPGQAPAPTAPTGLDTASSHVSTITLITGDVLDVRESADGKLLATVRPAADGTRALVKSVEHAGDLYMIPLEAEPHLQSDSLDRELFNVTRLIEVQRVTGSPSIPLIATYDDDPSRRQLAGRDAPAHSRRQATLESIDGLAVDVRRPAASAFWARPRRRADRQRSRSVRRHRQGLARRSRRGRPGRERPADRRPGGVGSGLRRHRDQGGGPRHRL